MLPLHTLEVQDGSTLAQSDRLLVALRMAVANLIGGGAGTLVTVAVTFAQPMPANYVVLADTGQDTVNFATAKTTLGFTLNILPRLAANTVAAGAVNILILA